MKLNLQRVIFEFQEMAFKGQNRANQNKKHGRIRALIEVAEASRFELEHRHTPI